MFQVNESTAYQSLFSTHAHVGYKLSIVREVNNNALLVDSVGRLPKKTSSIVTRRESTLYCLADQLLGRYRYDDEGNYAQMYQPSKRPRTNARLKDCATLGVQLFRDLKGKGFEDKTLRDALGMAYASLDRDSAVVMTPEVFSLGPAQVFRDALDASLAGLAKFP